jgi:predicted alpha/beta-hydrolase family hydrolase
VRPDGARALLVLAHGAGAGMRHAFLESFAQSLAAGGVATFRYQFPYTEKSGRRPDPPAVLEATVRSAVEAAARAAPGLPLFAGGKSMGGRMTSRAASEGALPGVRGLVFAGFPLHAAGQPGVARADHLDAVPLPMLFLQGTRDHLADLASIRAVAARLGERASLHVVEGADHSFHVPKSSGRTDAAVLDELGREVVAWTERVLAGAS